ncbi:hypothetical protein BIT28_16070 [Photobacterium proteolyticum]|uniref:Uncharacterized protein n=1 Tax=Photobacterium proteolyticum TaxID=1903952 RepID=A0A1Q9GZH8_9GAMM|nr:DUF4037 domain-containing protein [Photobacterium proteolyticum]OLQ80582.1 hypothetical protein BIT28_16070 [Photobacterium proteolyticum]
MKEVKDNVLLALLNEFAGLKQVDAIAIAGSHGTQMNDSLSDYDIYVYVNDTIPVEVRQQITSHHCCEMEVNNQYWETEDDGRLNSGTEVELIYRSIDWLDKELERVLFKHQPNVGYSTCFWSNLLSSKVIFDRDSTLMRLQDKYTVDYSRELAAAVIAKNLPLLCDAAPAYPQQIIKAIKRQDYLSVQHRLTAYLDSYFDILFAANLIPHPGEKRLVEVAVKLCSSLPADFEQTMENLLFLAGTRSYELPLALNIATENLKAVVEKSGINYQVC